MFQFHSFQVDSAVYYVLFDGPRYRIRKTRISEITKRPSSRLYFDKYYYRCEDGYSFESVEALVNSAFWEKMVMTTFRFNDY